MNGGVSLYRDTMRPAPETAALQGDLRVDVAVVGAGITGLSSALHLAEAGSSVAVLESRSIGWGASGRNGGQVNPGLKWDPDRIEADWGPELGGRMIRFAWGAADATFSLIRRLGIDCDARQGGTMRAAYRERHAVAVRTTAEQCVRRGLPVDMLEGTAAREATGTDRYVAIMRDRSGGDLQPLDYTSGLARSALAAGAAIFTQSPVTSLSRQNGHWLLTTPGGTVTADWVILATNGYSDGLLPGLARSIVPVYSSIMATEPLSDEARRQVLPARSSLYESGHITVYYRVDAHGRLLMGGRGPQSPLTSAGPVGYLADYATRLWPVLNGVQWSNAWNGQIAVTTDHYPHIHLPAPGLASFVGCNGRGVALSTVLGRELARLATGTGPADLPMPVSEITPIRFHRFWKAGVVGKVWEGRMRDWLGR